MSSIGSAQVQVRGPRQAEGRKCFQKEQPDSFRDKQRNSRSPQQNCAKKKNPAGPLAKTSEWFLNAHTEPPIINSEVE